MIRRILVPTDGSGTANEALALAADLAERHEATLILLHVGSPGRGLPAGLEKRVADAFAAAQAREGSATTGAPRGLAEFTGRMILEEAEALARAQGADRLETILEFGDVTERILHHAVRQSADMISMGSRGHSELKGLLIGSVSNKVQHHAPCTTLVVHDPKDEGARALRTILVAVDGSPDANKALELASDIAAKAQARLVVAHALLEDALPERVRALVDPAALSGQAREDLENGANQAEALRYAALPVPQLPVEVLQEVGTAVLDRCLILATSAGLSDVETVLLDGDPAEGIVAEADKQQADLLVLGSRGLGALEALLLGSVSHKVSRLATCPSIVVR